MARAYRNRRYLHGLPARLPRESMQQRLRDDMDQPPQATVARPATPLSPVRRRLLILCLLVGFFFSLLDTTIVSTSLLATANDLKDFRDGSWVVLSYLLTYMGFSIVLAKLSDIYGRRRILLASWLIFAVFSVACGCAATMTQLIIFRAMQGIGGAGLYSLTTIALPEIEDKPQIIGPLAAITLSCSFALGPILGGAIPQLFSWRLIYWINAPFCLVTTTSLAFLYPRNSQVLDHRRSLRRIDFPGSILLLAATIGLVFALQQGGSLTFSWTSAPIVATLVLSAVSCVLFCGWETWLSYGSRDIEPVFPLRLVAKRVYLACLLTKFLVGYVYLSLVLILPQRFQLANGDSYWTAGLHLFPLLGGTAVGCFISGPINSKKNQTSCVTVISCAFILVGIGLFNTLRSADDDIRPQYGFQVIFGLGVGLFLSAATMMSVAQAPLDHAVAQGAIAQARVLGGLIGLAIATVILNYRVERELAGRITPEQLAVLRQSPANLIARWPEIQHLVRETYAGAFATMVQTMTAVAAAALVTSLFTLEKNPPPIHGNLADAKDAPPSRGNSDVEMDDLSSDHSVVDVVEPALPPRARERSALGA